MIGWLGLVLYGFPGYMSYDSTHQFEDARWRHFSDAHPPAMAEMWRFLDGVVTGPLLMLLVQATTFLVGGYLLFRRFVAPRTAAVMASLVLWFPPILATMAVIWKDSQMAGFLMLGTALVLSERRGVRLWGLASLAAASAMRHNAFAMTLPLVVLLFVWRPGQRWWRRYAISTAAWVVITLAARLFSSAITDEHRALWHESLALYDMVGTLRYTADTVPDAELLETLAGTPLQLTHDLQAATREPFGPGSEVDQLWTITHRMFKTSRIVPLTESQNAAIARAWRTIVLGHSGGYLRYRWMVFRQLVQLTDVPLGNPVYRWFVDVQDPGFSVAQIRHEATHSRLQNRIGDALTWLGDTALFHIHVYLFLALLLLPLCVGEREAFAILASGLSGEALLFVITPTTDFRYSFWLIVATVVGGCVLVARRAKRYKGAGWTQTAARPGS